jgi:hypothetical protein
MMVQEWLTELGCETIDPADAVPVALELIAKQRPDAARRAEMVLH